MNMVVWFSPTRATKTDEVDKFKQYGGTLLLHSGNEEDSKVTFLYNMSNLDRQESCETTMAVEI